MSFSLLLSLPGEIRNQIFNLCIAEARKGTTSRSLAARETIRYGRSWIQTNVVVQSCKDVEVSILPKWDGHSQIITSGIAGLPLLFVNRQIRSELSSLVDIKVSQIAIGPYSIQFVKEDPCIRWNMAYELLKQRPCLLDSVKSVKVSLPWMRVDLIKQYWLGFGHQWVNRDPRCYGLDVIPGLIKCLKNFKSLSSLEIILVAETCVPPDMSPLFQLYELSGTRVTINIMEPQSQDMSHFGSSSLGKWESAWFECRQMSKTVS